MVKKELNYTSISYFFIFALVIFLSFLIIKPYVISLLFAGVLAFIFFPVYRFLNKYIKRDYVSAFLTTLLVFIIFLAPAIYIANVLLKEAISISSYIRSYDLDTLVPIMSNIFGSGFDEYFSNTLDVAGRYVISGITQFVITLPGRVIQLFIILFAFYYALKDHKLLVRGIKSVLPFNEKNKELLLQRFKDLTYALVYGTMITAIVQGVFATIGFFVFGIPNPFFFGLVVVIVGILPLLGPALVWLPAVLYLIVIQGDFFNGILLAIYSVIFIVSIDYLIKPKIVSKRGDVHPLLVVIGLIGGIAAFGIFGVFLGPLILLFFILFMKIYGLNREEKITE